MWGSCCVPNLLDYCYNYNAKNETYTELGDYQVYGINLVEEANVFIGSDQEYTCPTHPEIVQYESGCCCIGHEL